MLCEFESSDQRYISEISKQSDLLSGLNLQNSTCLLCISKQECKKYITFKFCSILINLVYIFFFIFLVSKLKQNKIIKND